jgi:UDP-N-acetylglucosamine 2-epimerase (non-hydrolysing)
MKKVLFIFGTRPEAIKLAPVIKCLKLETQKFQVKVCVTAQHREMLDQALNFFEIIPDYDLDTMRKDQSLFDITINGLRKVENILKKENADIVLVQGDTTTAFIATLAAFYFKLKIGHIEAGLRTKDRYNPFPEEINRRLVDCIADLYFAPTNNAKESLLREGVDEHYIFVTGNTGIDALLTTVEKQNNDKTGIKLKQKFKNKYGISVDSRRIILVTGHRRENFGEEFKNICSGLKKIARGCRDVQVIYPVHLNPNVQKPVRNILSGEDNVHLIEPLDYPSFVWLMDRSYLILTDSGGIQEEAPSLGKPVLVMRKKTERPEGIECGTAKLVGSDRGVIYSETTKLLEDRNLYENMVTAVNPYGDGKASERICKVLQKCL